MIESAMTLVKTMHLVQDFSEIVIPTEYCCVFLQQYDEDVVAFTSVLG